MQFSEVISNEWDGFFDRKNDFSFLKLKDLFDFLPTTLQNSLEMQESSRKNGSPFSSTWNWLDRLLVLPMTLSLWFPF